MFLFWNYTIEAFFWIILAAIALVSLTIFFASPKQKSKPLSVLEKRDGEIIESDKYAKKESNFDSEKSRPVTEDEKFEAFVETLPRSFQAVVSMRTYIGIFCGLLILALGFAALEIQEERVYAGGFLTFSTAIFGSIAFIYGLIQNSHFTTRWGARLMIISLFLFPISSGFGYLEAGILACITLTYSNDLIWFWRLFAHRNTARESNVRSSLLVELMNGERPAAARLLLYLLLFFFFWMSFSMLASIAS